MMRKTPFNQTVAILAGSLALTAVIQLNLIKVAKADEVDEELRSTIGSDPIYRGKKHPSSSSGSSEATVPASSSHSSSGDVEMNNGDESGEWNTSHSEDEYHRIHGYRGKGGVSSGGGGSSSMKIDVEKKRIYTPKISFASNSANPTPQSIGVIRSLGVTLSRRPDIAIRVEGHTDSIGYDQPNLELSQKRADKVRDILVESGVPANRIQSVGMGDRYPVASSATPQGQEKNRRVEIHITDILAAPAPAAPAPMPMAAAPVPAAPAPYYAPAPAPAAPAPAPAAPAPRPPVPVAAAPVAPVAPAPAPVAPAAPAPAAAPVAPAPAPLAPAPQ